MFNFSWSEIAVIVAVALVLIGPKDLPAGLKTLAQLVRKVRGMASEFQGHMDEMLRDADLGDIKQQISDIRHFDIKGAVERAIDPDHSIAKTLSEDPFATTDGSSATSATEAFGAADPSESASVASSAVSEPEDAELGAPAFIPPDIAIAVLRPPAFIPPELLPLRS